MGQEKPEYNELYDLRIQKLQNNAVLNKQKKDLESQANNPLAASATETSPIKDDKFAQQKSKLQEEQAVELNALKASVLHQTFQGKL